MLKNSSKSRNINGRRISQPMAATDSLHLAAKAGPDRVEWIDTCTGIDVTLLSARVACTPDEYEIFKNQLTRTEQSKASAADRSLNLLGILQAFQRYFNSGWIEVKEDDSAAESGAIEVMDAADLSF